MILTKQFHNLKCDSCGAILQDEWYSVDEVKLAANECGWIEDKGKHYCPDCYSYDDKDNLVINKQK